MSLKISPRNLALSSIWRLYLNPLSSYEQFQRFFAIEFENANNEASRRIDVLRDQVSKFLVKEFRDEGNLELANAFESGKVRWSQLDRAKKSLIVDPDRFDIPQEVFEIFRMFSADRTNSFSDLLMLFETGLDNLPPKSPLEKRVTSKIFDYFKKAFASALYAFRMRTADLRPDLVGSVRDVSTEYLEWIKGHSDVLD